MKRFCMYSVILIVAVFLGFSVYYFLQNNEHITLAFSESDTVKVNMNDTLVFDELIVHKFAHDDTEFEVETSNPAVLPYNAETKLFTATQTGTSVVTITPSNKKFGPFIFTVKVGNGLTAEYPNYIDSVEELESIGKPGSSWTLNMHYELISDIYLTSIEWNPIGEGNQFTGVFNGGNYTIYNLAMTNTNDAANAGLFSVVGTNGQVKNVKLASASITGEYDNAGVVAGINRGTINNCEITDASVVSVKENSNVGGAVGLNQFYGKTRAKIGMVGVVNTQLAGSGNVGGIAGQNVGSMIENSFAHISELTAQSTTVFGGIVGSNEAFTAEIQRASVIKFTHVVFTSEEDYSSLKAFGGVIGYADDKSTNAFNIYESNIYAVSANAVATQNATNTDTFSVDEFTQRNIDEMKIQASYTGFDFENTWTMGENYAVIDYTKPYIADVIIDPVTPPSDPDDNDPSIDPDDPGTVIPSEHFMKAVLREMRDNPDSQKDYYITESFDIDFSTEEWEEFSPWVPIGNANEPFTGKFYVKSGVSVTFRNLTISNFNNAGFFGVLGASAYVSGFTFVNFTINVKKNEIRSTNPGAGVIAGKLEANATIQNCYVKGFNINAVGLVGGVAGINNGNITNVEVKNNGAVSATMQIRDETLNYSGSSIGAIAGANAGVIKNVNVANVDILGGMSTLNYMGAIAGENSGTVWYTTAKNVSITTAENESAQVGGIVGYNDNSIRFSYITDSEIVLNSDTTTSAGGIAGVNTTNGTIAICGFVNSEVTARNAAGITVDNYGLIWECAVGDVDKGKGKIKAVYGAGFVVTNHIAGNIQDCYVVSDIVGLSTSGICSGFVNDMKTDSKILHCYSVANITGEGELWADTKTTYRNIWANLGNTITNTLFGNNENLGFIEESLIVNVNNNYLQGFYLPLDIIPNPLMYRYDITIAMEDAEGKEDYKVFIEKDFSSNVWEYDYAEKHVPQLKHVSELYA